MRLFLKFTIQGADLVNAKNFVVGRMAPYFEFFRQRGHSWDKVGSTQVAYDSTDPVFEGVCISMHALCNGDPDRKILVKCMDSDMHGTWQGPFLIGSFITSVAQMQHSQDKTPSKYPVVNPTKRARERNTKRQGQNYVNSGQAWFSDVQLCLETTQMVTSYPGSVVFKRSPELFVRLEFVGDLRGLIKENKYKDINPRLDVYCHNGKAGRRLGAEWTKVFTSNEAKPRQPVKPVAGSPPTEQNNKPDLSEPLWHSFLLPCSVLCKLDSDWPILIEVRHYSEDRNKPPKLLGHVETSLRQLLEEDFEHFAEDGDLHGHRLRLVPAKPDERAEGEMTLADMAQQHADELGFVPSAGVCSS